MKKVLITYASAGDGHKKAAQALYEVFLNSYNDRAKVVLIDALEYTTPVFGFCYRHVYEIMIRYMPWLWGFFYYTLNNRFFFAGAAPFRRLINGVNSHRLKAFLLREDFDAVLSTHFFAPEIVSHLKEKGLSRARLINIVTDFRPHRFWAGKGIDGYFVASDDTKTDLIKIGVDSGKISVSGIPVNKGFVSMALKKNARESIGVKEDMFTVLLMGGGLGVGPIEKILLNLQRLDLDFQVIAVCGRNKMLADKLERLRKVLDKKVFVYGFSDEVDKLMAASDIMISKSGGVTVSESLAAGLPVITLRPIPGQETGNAEFLSGAGIGFWVTGLHEINSIITKFFGLTQDIGNLKRTIARSAKPRAALDIARSAMEMIT
jgi:processive 1,2-diacylglycerol beta-glucosyltransferase